MAYILLLGGLALILFGANILTDGAAALAKRFNISDLVIGLTIVAFGTSAPELVISVISAIKDSSELALGNVIGSNIFNILMIVGCTALIMPLTVGQSTQKKEIPLVILSSLVLWFCSSDMLFDGASSNLVSRTDGMLLLGFFLIFMYYTFSIAKSSQPGQDADSGSVKEMKLWKSIIWIIGGLAGLIFGGQGFVDGASEIAASFGVSESVIGLTIVAAGTSLPELATSVIAALKKKPAMAIGNVVGSSLFNVFFIVGVSATIRPLKVGAISSVDFGMLIGAAVLLWIFSAAVGKSKVSRIEGGVMVACFIGYTIWLVLNA